MGLFKTHTKELYCVVAPMTTSRSGPYIALHTVSGTHVSRILQSFPAGKILRVYEVENGFGKVSRFKEIWVPMKDLTRV